MNQFSYRDGLLHAENLSVADLATEYGTPFYLYSASAIRENYEAFDSALRQTGINYDIFYAVKANSNQAVIGLLKDCGSGADVVSVGEIKRALLAGIPANKIVFSGVGKSEAEIAYALNSNILQFNVESESELALLNRIAESKGKIAEIALRVNPDVDAKSTKRISTGTSDNKFGIPLAEASRIYKEANDMAGIKPCAIAMHIGSQLTSLSPYRKAWEPMAKLAKELIANGIDIQRLDLGGGIGVAYKDDRTISMTGYAKLITEIFTDLDVSFMFEPGRSIVADSGILVSRVVHTKKMPQSFSEKLRLMRRRSRDEYYRQRQSLRDQDLSPEEFLSMEPELREKHSKELKAQEKQIKKQHSLGENVEYNHFIICDAAMNDFIRPTLYGGYHHINSVVEEKGDTMLTDIVGPVCESGDYFAKGRDLPVSISSGDLIYISHVGAYGAVMSGTYNTRPLIAEVMVQGNESALIRPAITEDEIIAQDKIPTFF